MGYIQQICCSGNERDVREYLWANFCSCAAVENLCLRAHIGDGDALRHGVDEARECVLREGEAASLKPSCVTNKALEVCAQCFEYLNG